MRSYAIEFIRDPKGILEIGETRFRTVEHGNPVLSREEHLTHFSQIVADYLKNESPRNNYRVEISIP